MPQITIDGKQYEVEAGANLLEAVLGLGLDLPYFCWHPAMGSVGSCRQCAMMQYQNAEDERSRALRSIKADRTGSPRDHAHCFWGCRALS